MARLGFDSLASGSGMAHPDEDVSKGVMDTKMDSHCALTVRLSSASFRCKPVPVRLRLIVNLFLLLLPLQAGDSGLSSAARAECR